MSIWEAVGWTLAGVLLIWITARLVSSAYFLSRQQYEERKHPK